MQAGGLAGMSAIAAGGVHSLAVKSNGTLWAWGRNDNGQLGDGTTTDRWTAVQAGGPAGMTGVAGGGSHSLARQNNRVAWAWGDNAFGQLGDGSTTDRLTAVWTNLSIKYYHFGAQRIAQRRYGVLYYLGADHLASTSVVLDAAGSLVAEARALRSIP